MTGWEFLTAAFAMGFLAYIARLFLTSLQRVIGQWRAPRLPDSVGQRIEQLESRLTDFSEEQRHQRDERRHEREELRQLREQVDWQAKLLQRPAAPQGATDPPTD